MTRRDGLDAKPQQMLKGSAKMNAKDWILVLVSSGLIGAVAAATVTIYLQHAMSTQFKQLEQQCVNNKILFF